MSDSTLLPRRTFVALHPELRLHIISYMSPYDLVNFRITSKDSMTIVNDRKCFKIARSRMFIPVPDPPNVNLFANLAESAYAAYIFGGGLCDACGKRTENSPISFSLGTRLCNKKCLDTLRMKHDPFIISRRLDKLRHQEQFHAWSSYAEEESQGYRLYGLPAIITAIELEKICGPEESFTITRNPKTLKQEWARRKVNLPLIIKNTMALRAWKNEYVSEFKVTGYLNSIFLNGIAKEERQKKAALYRSPTLLKYLSAFNRDLETLTHHFWSTIHDTVLKEIAQAKTGTLPVGSEIHATDRIRCKYCPQRKTKLFTPANLLSHIAALHKDTFKEAHTTFSVGPKLSCAFCPGSRKLFCSRGMRDHIGMKHPKLPL